MATVVIRLIIRKKGEIGHSITEGISLIILEDQNIPKNCSTTTSRILLGTSKYAVMSSRGQILKPAIFLRLGANELLIALITRVYKVALIFRERMMTSFYAKMTI